ncbi:MAG: hypothetical protein PHW82_11960 [Bacteroidales bacterium]|nr:hypothetical protein [Bacteroidales bacterium]
MKKIKIIFIVLLTIIIFNSCEKEYPKDTPDWLKTRIDSIIDNRDSYGCSSYGECLIIDEYVNNNQTIYIEKVYIHLAVSNRYKIFNDKGYIQCDTLAIDENNWCDTCGTITNLKNSYYVRTIWSENN